MQSRSPTEPHPDETPGPAGDAARIVRFMLAKAAIFIVAPLCLALLVVWLTLR